MIYAIEKLIFILNIVLKDTSLLDEEAFNMIDKLCTKLNNIEE